MEIVYNRLGQDIAYEVEEYLVAGKVRFLKRNGALARVPVGNYGSKLHGRHYYTSFQVWGLFAWRTYYFRKKLYYYSIEYTIGNTTYRFTQFDEYYRDVHLKERDWEYELDIDEEEIPYHTIFNNPRRSIQ